LEAIVVTGPAESAPESSVNPLFVTAAYYAAFLALALVPAALGPTLTDLSRYTRSPLDQVSYLFTARALGYIIGSTQAGRLYDRFPGHKLLTIALVVTAALAAVIPLIPHFWPLVTVLLLLGIAGGAIDLGGNTLLVWLHRSRVGPYMNGLHFFYGVGAFLSPVIVAQTIGRLGDGRWAYLVMATLTLPVALLLARLPSPKPQASSEGGTTVRGRTRDIVLISIFMFCIIGAEATFGDWIATYSQAIGVAGKRDAAYVTAAFWGALTMGRLLGIPAAARFSPSQLLLADTVGAVISAGAIVASPTSMIAVLAGGMGLGLSLASTVPAAFSLAERRMTITGQVNSLFFLGFSSGGMVLPWLVGRLFESVGPKVTVYVIAGDVVLALGTFLALAKRSRPIPHRSPA
jgi:FHS family Na+ dependent glucose MFS transporter 1